MAFAIIFYTFTPFSSHFVSIYSYIVFFVSVGAWAVSRSILKCCRLLVVEILKYSAGREVSGIIIATQPGEDKPESGKSRKKLGTS